MGASMVIGLLAAVVLIAVLGSTALTISRSASAVQSRNASSQLAQQTLYAVAQRADAASGVAGILPTAGGAAHPQGSDFGLTVPSGSGGATVDANGVPFVYCPFDNVNVNPAANFVKGTASPNAATPVLAIIGAGADRKLQTSCETVRTTSAAAPGSDDLVRVMNGQQIVQGTGGSNYFGDPVETVSDLQSIVSPRPGELRVVKETGGVYVSKPAASGASGARMMALSSSSGEWSQVSGGGGAGAVVVNNVGLLPTCAVSGSIGITSINNFGFYCDGIKWTRIAAEGYSAPGSALIASPAAPPAFVVGMATVVQPTILFKVSGGKPPYYFKSDGSLSPFVDASEPSGSTTGEFLLSTNGNVLPDKLIPRKSFTITVQDATAQSLNVPIAVEVADISQVIDLGAGNGKLIGGFQDSGKLYYFWDRSGDGTSDQAKGDDRTTQTVLGGIFNRNAAGQIETSTNAVGIVGATDDTFRYGTINGIKLALPTSAELKSIFTAAGGQSPAKWSGIYNYWSATNSADGHFRVNTGGSINSQTDAGFFLVCLQVLP